MENPTKRVKLGAFGLYWSDYGGLRALMGSSYLHIAVIFSIVSFPIWMNEGWWDTVISVVPSLAGFSLAAYAMLIAFGNERFLRIITTPVPVEGSSEKDRVGPSIYLTTGAAFVHFIIVQSVALLIALLCKAWFVPVWPLGKRIFGFVGLSEMWIVYLSRSFWGIGYFVFIYSVLCGLAATMRIYRMSRWYSKLLQSDPPAGQVIDPPK
jgi:hypothetical protein